MCAPRDSGAVALAIDTGANTAYLFDPVGSGRATRQIVGAAVGIWALSCRGDPSAAPAPKKPAPKKIDLLDYRTLLEDGAGKIRPQLDARYLPSFRVSGGVEPSWEVFFRIREKRLPAILEPIEPGGSREIYKTRTSTRAITAGSGSVEIHDRTTGVEVRSWPVVWSEAPEALPALERFRSLLSSDPKAARVELEKIAPLLDPVSRIWAKGKIAERSSDKIRAWSEYAEAAIQTGIPTEATRGWRNAAFNCWEARRLSEVEPLLSKAEAIDQRIGHARGHATTLYYRGMVATDTGYYRRAVADFTEGNRLAWSLGLDQLAMLHLDYLATTLQEEGLHQEARHRLEEVASYFERHKAATSSASTSLERRAYVSYRNTLAWVLLRGMVQGAFARDFARLRDIEQEAKRIAGQLKMPKEEANIAANLAWIAHLEGDRKTSHALIGEAARLDPSEHGYASVFLALTEGKLLLEERRFEESDARFSRALELARAESGGEDSDFTWRASYGRGQAAMARADHARALQHFRAGLEGLERLAMRTDIQRARAFFFEERRPLVEDMVELLLADGATGEAFLREDEARARIVRGLESRARAERLKDVERVEWERRVGSYLELRNRYAEAPRKCELLAGKAEKECLAETEEIRRSLASAFDAAYAYLDEHASSLVAPAVPAEQIAAVLAADEALVTFFTVHGKRSVFVVRPGAVRHFWVEGGDLSRAIAQLHGAKHLYVVPGGVDAALELATLPVEDGSSPKRALLIQSLSITYLPYASALLRRGDRPSPSGPPLIVADPSQNLPFAREEGELVHRLLPGSVLLPTEKARRSEVLALMNNARVFHFAGHGESRPDQPWDAHLKLRGGETLSLEELMIARPKAGVVVLSGCETGRPGTLSASERVGLPEAFLLAGARAVLATDLKVNDNDALVRFIRRFYEAGGADQPARAFQQAAVASLREGDRTWQAFRVVGGR